MESANSSHIAPLVSIIVPIYNTRTYLNRCLKSIIEQSYPHLDIILVDDGSTDDSIIICKDFASRDSRIRIFSQQNGGASTARNTGLDHAKGDYVIFVDSDDWIDNDMVEQLTDDIVSHHTSLVISQVPGDKVCTISKTFDRIEALETILKRVWWGPVGKIFKRGAIGDLRFPHATISEDYVFMVHAILRCEHIFYDSKCFYHREAREGSLSRSVLSKRMFEEFNNVSHVAEFIKENHPEFRKHAEARLAETSLKLLFAIYQDGKSDEFSNQQNMLVHSIRSNILRYLPNKHILFTSRILLFMCTTTFGSKTAYRLYSWAK